MYDTVSSNNVPEVDVYGKPEIKFGAVMAMMAVHSPRQAMLMESILIDAMKRYAGRPEEGLIAKWHHEIVYMLKNAEAKSWVGWEDTCPIEHKDNAQ